MRAIRILLLAVPILATDGGIARAQSADTTLKLPISRNGSWSAATAGGLTLMGTWTVTLDTAGTALGTWILEDAQGNRRAEGGWSAAKSPEGWTGAWRAIVSGRDGEYAGTWSATVDAKPDAPLAEMFAKAMQAVVNGTWRVGNLSGAWAIRTFK